ncbi:hypothetical protein FACS1894172_18360 [Spirochaetia bacterium]|nr:hypothetical protein FACS1894172_18360 [Spirochaetia bacterium]
MGTGWIQGIPGIIPHTNKNVDIALDGKNLIITGANGSGKTSLLKAIYDKEVRIYLNLIRQTGKCWHLKLMLLKGEIADLVHGR